MKKKTQEEYIADVKIKNPDVEVLGVYQGNKIKIAHKCLLCGKTFEASPNSILCGKGCPDCRYVKSAQKLRGRCRTSHEEYISKGTFSPYIKITGRFAGWHQPLEYQCLRCGKNSSALASNLRKIEGCADCVREQSRIKILKQGEEKFWDWFYSQDRGYEVLSEYTGSTNYITLRCKKCGRVWEARPTLLMSQDTQCPSCASVKVANFFRKTSEEIASLLKQKAPEMILTGEYKNYITKTQFKCTKCGYELDASLDYVLRKGGCPICIERSNMSSGEKLIANYLLTKRIKFVIHHSFNDLRGKNNKRLSYDFFLPEYNMLIEFQGKQHVEPFDCFGGEHQFKLQQQSDFKKRKYATDNGYNFIEIWYDEIKEIEHIIDTAINNYKPESVETVTGA